MVGTGRSTRGRMARPSPVLTSRAGRSRAAAPNNGVGKRNDLAASQVTGRRRPRDVASGPSARSRHLRLCHLLSALFTPLFVVSLPPFVIFCLLVLPSCSCILILPRLRITPRHSASERGPSRSPGCEAVAVIATTAKGYDLDYAWRAVGEAYLGAGYSPAAAEGSEPPGTWWRPRAERLGFAQGRRVERVSGLLRCVGTAGLKPATP
jgi:hypothetical protein